MDFYFKQEIDNSKVVRVEDPRRRRELRMHLLAAAIIFLLVLGHSWQRYRMVQIGYKLEAVRVQQLKLDRWNEGLQLEEASLRNPNRIYALAKTSLGLTTSQPDQVIAISDPAAPRRPMMAVIPTLARTPTRAVGSASLTNTNNER